MLGLQITPVYARTLGLFIRVGLPVTRICAC